jgi:hypothetical protein
MDISTTARPLSTGPARVMPDTHLELRWRAQHTSGRPDTLVAEWVLVAHAHEQREAA